MSELVALDVGGTHARFALATVAADGAIALGEPVTFKTSDYVGMLEEVWDACPDVRNAWVFGRESWDDLLTRAEGKLRRKTSREDPRPDDVRSANDRPDAAPSPGARRSGPCGRD